MRERREERGVSEEDWNARRTGAGAEQSKAGAEQEQDKAREVPGGLGGTGVEWVYPLAGWLAKEKKKKESLACLGPAPQSGLDEYNGGLKSGKYLVEIMEVTESLYCWKIDYDREGEIVAGKVDDH
jgi:hypothetical protein